MERILEEKELLVLECINNSKEPIGSWHLVERLEDKNINISSATIGRILTHLEKLGYVEKESFKGRIITPKGIEAIEKSKTLEEINFHKSELDKLINTKVLEDFIMVLQARQAIERETARLAAENITQEEIESMEKKLICQEENYKKGLSIAQDDIDFHKAIAKASKNAVLESLYNIISTSGQQSRLFEYIRAQVRSPYNESHRNIYNAIKNHNSIEAERHMIAHMQNLFKDVSAYWDKYNDSSIQDDGGKKNER